MLGHTWIRQTLHNYRTNGFLNDNYETWTVCFSVKPVTTYNRDVHFDEKFHCNRVILNIKMYSKWFNGYFQNYRIKRKRCYHYWTTTWLRKFYFAVSFGYHKVYFHVVPKASISSPNYCCQIQQWDMISTQSKASRCSSRVFCKAGQSDRKWCTDSSLSSSKNLLQFL